MSKKQQRENKILELLQQNKTLSTKQVTSILNISESSTRRLFIEMENSGKVIRTYGGIQLSVPKDSIYSFEALEDKNIEQKKQIAILAASLIRNDDIVYFDSGTTLLQLSLIIKQKINNGELERIRIVTNSIANLQVLNDSCEIILCGGQFREYRKDFAGYATERFVQTFLYTKAFLGADGLQYGEGFMATDTDTAKLNEVVLQRSKEVYVLLDSTKIGRASFVSYAGMSKVKALITDDNINKDLLNQYINGGVNIILPEMNHPVEKEKL